MGKIKTIDINAKEWFDKVNGNSYFAGVIIINFGMKDCREYVIPYEYGYGDYYIDAAKELLQKQGEIDYQKNENGSSIALWQYCQDNKIILRYHKQENCLKRELMNF